jgi:ribose transport system ATP-binding protein
MAALVSLANVSKSFGAVRVLDGVHFELLPGEVHALMGENGAGKSTLMKILAGVHAKDGGEMRVDGQPVDVASPRQAQQLGIGIIHQELNLMNHLTAAQNLFIGREPRRFGLFLDDEALNARAQAIFDTLHLQLDPRTVVGTLTVARQQMVEIAKALSFDSRVLIMDEPTAALNDAEVADLFRVIAQLKARGVGIVYISHKMDELRRIADRVTVMRDGQTVGTVAMADTPVDRIIAMMVGRELAAGDTPEVPDHAGAEVLLDVRHLARGRAVRDVSFTLRRGEILGFAGLMGAGRTEVARAIFGADALEAGEIHVRGQRVVIKAPEDAVRHGIGYLSEDRKHFGLATGLDVETNIVMPSLRRFARAGFVDSAATRRAAQDGVRRLRIKTAGVGQPVRLLSGGNQQKIVIAKWLLRDCDILFFDEPTRGIDIGAKSEIYQLIRELAAQGKAIVLISSELPEVLRMSHRILVMCEGRITGELPGGRATQEDIMRLATRRDAAAPLAQAA